MNFVIIKWVVIYQKYEKRLYDHSYFTSVLYIDHYTPATFFCGKLLLEYHNSIEKFTHYLSIIALTFFNYDKFSCNELANYDRHFLNIFY